MMKTRTLALAVLLAIAMSFTTALPTTGNHVQKRTPTGPTGLNLDLLLRRGIFGERKNGKDSKSDGSEYINGAGGLQQIDNPQNESYTSQGFTGSVANGSSTDQGGTHLGNLDYNKNGTARPVVPSPVIMERFNGTEVDNDTDSDDGNDDDVDGKEQ